MYKQEHRASHTLPDTFHSRKATNLRFCSETYEISVISIIVFSCNLPLKSKNHITQNYNSKASEKYILSLVHSVSMPHRTFDIDIKYMASIISSYPHCSIPTPHTLNAALKLAAYFIDSRVLPKMLYASCVFQPIHKPIQDTA